MLSKRAKYAIKACLHLYRNQHKGVAISVRVISDFENIPYKFLENILRELKQNHIVKSERGAEGGYRLAKPPSEIRVSEILRILDGPIALIPCVSETFYEKCPECKDENTCRIRRLFMDVRTHMLPLLNCSLVELEKYVIPD